MKLKYVLIPFALVFLFICLCSCLIMLGATGQLDKYTATPVYGVLIDDPQMIPAKDTAGQYYRLALQYKDGSIEVFYLMPNMAFGQLEVGSIAARLHKGDRIKATAVGFTQLYFLGWYRNLINPTVLAQD